MWYFGYVFALTIFLGSSCGSKVKDVVPDPKADFSYSVDEMNKLKIKFTNESENTASFTWDFGDNKGTSVGKNPTYTYTSAGTYSVTLTTRNSAGASGIQKKNITVEPNPSIEFDKVSILGDSYSTFQGHVDPSSNEVWYADWQTQDHDVVNVEQTWWHQLLQVLDATMDKNNSYSGSTICNTGYDGANSTATSFVTRMTNLGNPDLIIIMGGTNDSWANSPMGSYKYSDWTTDDLKSFRPAFAKMLDYLTKQHPNARIVNAVNSGLKADVTTSQTTICAHYNVTCVQLQNIDKKANHPSISGMIAIKNQILKAIHP